MSLRLWRGLLFIIRNIRKRKKKRMGIVRRVAGGIMGIFMGVSSGVSIIPGRSLKM